MNGKHLAYLLKAAQCAEASGHPFKDYAACETALESTFGTSQLAVKYNNLFGQKQSTEHPVFLTANMMTKEIIHGNELWVPAKWVIFPDWPSCFKYRWVHLQFMAQLEVIENGERIPKYSGYAASVKATTGEEFITQVSKNWSTDEERGDKVLKIYKEWKGN